MPELNRLHVPEEVLPILAEDLSDRLAEGTLHELVGIHVVAVEELTEITRKG